MSDIVQARGIVREIAAELRGFGLVDQAEKLGVALDLMVREPVVRRAKQTRRAMNEDIAKAVVEDASRYPDTPLEEIGLRHGVSHGRVSEALHGKW